MNIKQIGEALASIPEPYADLPWEDISLCQYKEDTLVLCHKDHKPVVYGNNIGWRDVKMEKITEPITIKQNRLYHE